MDRGYRFETLRTLNPTVRFPRSVWANLRSTVTGGVTWGVKAWLIGHRGAF
jgi:hypothetical protein